MTKRGEGQQPHLCCCPSGQDESCSVSGWFYSHLTLAIRAMARFDRWRADRPRASDANFPLTELIMCLRQARRYRRDVPAPGCSGGRECYVVAEEVARFTTTRIILTIFHRLSAEMCGGDTDGTFLEAKLIPQLHQSGPSRRLVAMDDAVAFQVIQKRLIVRTADPRGPAPTPCLS